MYTSLLLSLASTPANAFHISPPSAVQLPHTVQPNVCRAEKDCSLGGQCGRQGKCHCSNLWGGSICGHLNIGNATMKNNGYQPEKGASWGGSPIRGKDGSYHMFVSYMETCGLNSWYWNSVIQHAVSQTPSGPYNYKSTVFPAFAHNPTITKAPDGHYLLYHIGQKVPFNVRRKLMANCSHTKELNHQDHYEGRIRLAYSKSLDGPWKLLRHGEPILRARQYPHWDSLITNPAPLVLSNGSVLLYYRGDDRYHPDFNGTRHRKIGVAFAETWKGPYNRVSNFPIFPGLGEDPVVFENPDHKGIHMIYENKFENLVGAHAFSEDGIRWKNIDDKPAYHLAAHLDSGATMKFLRRERPQFLRDENGYPQYLFNAVMPRKAKEGRKTPAESTWTFVSPVGIPISRKK